MLDCTGKDVTLAILMEYGQRVIIKFLFNKGADARQIAEGLRAQFHEDACALRTLQFWITELRRGREDLHDEPRTGRPSVENLPTKIQELLDEKPFESARSMAEILQSRILRCSNIYMRIFDFNPSICAECHIYWRRN
jgi:transposase